MRPENESDKSFSTTLVHYFMYQPTRQDCHSPPSCLACKCAHVCMCACRCVRTGVCVHVCAYVHAYVDMCICVFVCSSRVWVGIQYSGLNMQVCRT